VIRERSSTEVALVTESSSMRASREAEFAEDGDGVTALCKGDMASD
jgi:hypothetical protein